MSTERVFVIDALRLARTRCDIAWASEAAVALPGMQPAVRRRRGSRRFLAARSGGPACLDALAANAPSGLCAVAQSSPATLSVAIEFAMHVHDLRRCNTVVVCSDPVEDSPATIAFPHLLIVWSPPPVVWDAVGDLPIPFTVADGVYADTVLWELMPLRQLAAFGLDATTVRWWSRHLNDALELRTRHRAGLFGPAAAAAVVGRYVSFKFICEHDQLMRDELTRTAAT